MTEATTATTTETKTSEPPLVEKEEQITRWSDKDELITTVKCSMPYKDWCQAMVNRINTDTGRTLFVKARKVKDVEDAEVCVFELKRVRKVES